MRVAFIATGGIAACRIAACEPLGRTELVGVPSRSAGRAHAVKNQWGGGAFSDPARMLDGTRPDMCFLVASRAAQLRGQPPGDSDG